MSLSNLSLLVSSFDKYSMCWESFCHGINKYWPEHPPLYFITNYLEAPCGTSLKLGDDQGWAKNLLIALEKIPTEYVLYAQEDYWIRALVLNQHIVDYLAYLESGLADYIRLYPAPRPETAMEHEERLGVLAPNADYRASLQMALWRKSVLTKLVVNSETPWEFEVKGSQRSRTFGDRFLCVTNRKFGIDYVFSAIVNGYWSQAAYDYATKENISVDFAALPKKNSSQQVLDCIRASGFLIKKRLLKHLSKITEKPSDDKKSPV